MHFNKPVSRASLSLHCRFDSYTSLVRNWTLSSALETWISEHFSTFSFSKNRIDCLPVSVPFSLLTNFPILCLSNCLFLLFVNHAVGILKLLFQLVGPRQGTCLKHWTIESGTFTIQQYKSIVRENCFKLKVILIGPRDIYNY